MTSGSELTDSEEELEASHRSVVHVVSLEVMPVSETCLSNVSY